MSPHERLMEALLEARIKVAVLELRLERIPDPDTGYEEGSLQRIRNVKKELDAIERQLLTREASRQLREAP